MAWIEDRDLKSWGLRSVGKNVKISTKAMLYNRENISIGDNTRIDDFCLLSAGEGGIEIGNYCHIACYVSLQGKWLIKLEDFVGLSGKVSVYSSTDDFKGYAMTGPCIPDKYRKVECGPVYFNRHVVIGAGSVVLPGVAVGYGSTVGAMSLVNRSLNCFGIYAGIPARKIGDRKKDFMEMEKEFMERNEEMNMEKGVK